MLKIVSPMYNVSRCHAIGSDVEPQRSAKVFFFESSIVDAVTTKILHSTKNSRIASKVKESFTQ